jgi:LPS export ABC transporter protein LptC
MEFAQLAEVRNLHDVPVYRLPGDLHSNSSLLTPFQFVALALLSVSISTIARGEETPLLDVRGMTFVTTQNDDDTLILRAVRAKINTDEQVAFLEQVDAEVPATQTQSSFQMRCDKGEVDLATNDFIATGNVRGSSHGGGDFSTDWVRYDHSDGVLSTEAPVVIVDDGITYRGVGFRYDIEDRRFRLLGGASVLKSAPAEAKP